MVTFLNKKLVKLINHRIIWLSIWAQSLVGSTLINTNFGCQTDNTIPNIFLMLIGICLYEIVIFSHVVLSGSRFWDAWEGFIKNRRAITLKLVKWVVYFRGLNKFIFHISNVDITEYMHYKQFVRKHVGLWDSKPQTHPPTFLFIPLSQL